MDELWHYATIDRVHNVMRPYLEALGARSVLFGIYIASTRAFFERTLRLLESIGYAFFSVMQTGAAQLRGTGLKLF